MGPDASAHIPRPAFPSCHLGAIATGPAPKMPDYPRRSGPCAIPRREFSTASRTRCAVEDCAA
eukprot:10824282-Heterocapsa_arctica.AAC.1